MTPGERVMEQWYKMHPEFCSYEYRWANIFGIGGMITIEEAEYFGYEKFEKHLQYDSSWLMRRRIHESNDAS